MICSRKLSIAHSIADCGLRILLASIGNLKSKNAENVIVVFLQSAIRNPQSAIRNPQWPYRWATVVPEIRSGRVRRDALSHAVRYNGKNMNTIVAADARSIIRQSVTGGLAPPALTTFNLSSAIPNVRPAHANITT